MTDKTPDNSKQRKRWLLRLSFFFIVIGLLYFIYWIFIDQYYETTDDAYVSGNLVQVMPQISGHVTAILADETQLVKKGTPIILLDQADAKIALQNAESQLANVARQVSNLYQKVSQADANVKLQQANLVKAQEDYKRREGLVVDKVISEEDLQHAKIAVDSAQAAFDLAKNQFNSAVILVANTDLYHHPLVLQAEERLRNAYLTVQRTTIYAPESGYVAKRTVEVGQQVNPDSILMVIVPLDQIWVNANFKESQLKHFRIGQPANVISDLYGNGIEYKGTVAGISPGTGSTFDLLPPQNATGNWIKIIQRLPVRIIIKGSELTAYPLRLGLSMTVTVDTHHRQGAMLTTLPKNQILYQAENYGEELKKADALIQQILQSNAANITYPRQP